MGHAALHTLWISFAPSQFQQVVHENTVVASYVHAVEAGDGLADDPPVGVAADEGVREGVVEGEL